MALSEAQTHIRREASRFADEEIRPLAQKLDPQQGDIPPALIERMGALGYFGILIPEAEGGLGLGATDYCLIAEELSRGWMSVGSLLARGNGFYKFITGKDEAERRARVAAMAKGKFLGAYAISEPEAGSDVANISCRAENKGDHWLLTGNKYWCTFADGADFIWVVARSAKGTEKQRHKGLTAFSLPKPRGTLPHGVKGAPIPKIGYFGWKTWELAFDGVRVEPHQLCGQEGEAFYALAQELEIMRLHTAARAIGLAQAALDDALAYAQERRQFGQPIGDFQATRFKLANMATEIEAARALMFAACARLEAGHSVASEAAMAKLYASEMAQRTTHEALQIFGGAGYTKLHSVERYWRDARLTTIFEGSSQIMQKIISDRLLR